MTSSPRPHLFDAIGIEIESMIVDAHTFDIRPVADELFREVLGEPGSDVEGDPISWSNELVAHVVEFKTTCPAPNFEEMLEPFNRERARAEGVLRSFGCRLLPGGMHPWMNPRLETQLWPHENNEIYQSFDRIFGCQGHGWSNLQSTHLNLPFVGDDEFARLHTAIRLLVPIIPALAASSPFEEGSATGWLDNRMKHYAKNSAKLPTIAGGVVPEPVTSEEEYRSTIFAPMFAEIAPFDPDEIMREEWLNARGAIARFGRGSIEIRVIDAQESPRADLAVGAAIVAVVRALAEEKWATRAQQLGCDQAVLVNALESTARLGPDAFIHNEQYLACFGIRAGEARAGNLWKHLVGELLGKKSGIDESWEEPLRVILEKGPLARRLLESVGPEVSRESLHLAYGSLADALDANQSFDPISNR